MVFSVGRYKGTTMGEPKMAVPLQQEEVVALLEQGIMPPNWDITCSKVAFGLLKTIFEQLEILSIPQSKIIQICAKLCDKSEDAISKTINKVSNFKQNFRDLFS